MTTEDQRQLISDIVDKTSKGESKDEEEADNASGDTSSDIEEAEETLRRSSGRSRQKPDHIQWWNPQTKQYEGTTLASVAMLAWSVPGTQQALNPFNRARRISTS